MNPSPETVASQLLRLYDVVAHVRDCAAVGEPFDAPLDEECRANWASLETRRQNLEIDLRSLA